MSPKTLTTQIAISAGGSAVFALLAWVVTTTLGPFLLVLLASHCVVALLAVAFTRTTIRAPVWGRESAMSTNVALLKKRNKTTGTREVIRSTRFARWPAGEQSAARREFRQILDTCAMDETRPLRRLWNVSSRDDAVRLLEIMDSYSGHDNVSIKAFFDLPDIVMTELLIVGDRWASFSLPTNERPNEMSMAATSKNSQMASALRGHFDLLWERAEPVLTQGVRDKRMASRLQQRLT